MINYIFVIIMKLKKIYRIIAIAIIVCLNTSIYAQTGGNNTYEFLNLISSSRIAALGGNAIPINDNDLNLVIQNPSLLNKAMNNQLALSYVNYFSDINYGYAAYARTLKKLGTFYAGLQYVHYGKFTEADATGEKLGNFTPSEYALNIAYSKDLDSSFTVGAQLKNIYSHLYEYSSYGIAVDAAVTYHSKNTLFSTALVVKNMGVQIKDYTKGNNEPLPFEVQIGIANKFAKAPLRLLLVAQHLEKFDITYINLNKPDTYVDANTGETIIKDIKTIDKIIRHIIIGGEFIPTKNFKVSLGYNYQRRQELKYADKLSTVGFSFGFELKVSKFKISYGRAAYHLAGASNHFTVCTSLSDFYCKSEE